MMISRKTVIAISRPYVRSKSSQSKSPHHYCIDLVRKHDFENYLCTVFLRGKDQAKAFAVRAFNVEIANVAGQVSQATIGQMRLKFWEESVDKIFNDDPPHHPVALEVHRVIEKNSLNKRNLKKLIQSRADKLSLQTFPNLEEMEKYAESSCSPVYYLLSTSCGVENVHVDHAFSHLGKCHGLTNLVRSVPYFAQRKIAILPQDIMNKNKVSHETFIRGALKKPERDVVFEVASRAHSHLDKVVSLVDKVPKSLLRHFLPLVPLRGYLERLRLVDFDVFHPTLQARDNSLALKLAWRTITGNL